MNSRLDLCLYLLMALMFGAALWLGRDWPAGARIFPFLIGGAGLLLVVAGFLETIIGAGREQRAREDASVAKELATFGWISGFFGAVALFGFQWGLTVMIFGYLRFEAELKSAPSLLFAAVCWLFLYVMRAYLYIPLYDGWLASLPIL